MTSLLLALAIGSPLTPTLPPTLAPTSAPDLVNAARVQARREGKNVLVHFGASWCPWCRRLDALLNEPGLKPAFSRSYVEVGVTVRERGDRKALENPGWPTLMRRYRGAAAQDVPYLVILDPAGRELADSMRYAGEIPSNAGFPSKPDEIATFVGMIRKTGRFRPAELATLRKTLAATR